MTTVHAFDVNASFPADPKHRAAIEAMVAQSAEQAGCAPDVARDLAGEVGAAFVASAGTALPKTPVRVRLERAADRFEAVVSCGDTVRLSRPLAAIQSS